TGRLREELGELEGWAYLHTGISFWPNKKATADRAHVDWVIRAPKGTQIEVVADHERAGKVTRTVKLG
ncbi:MAG: carboxypeptidase, partial [Burkholderiaceae bacterium]